MPEQEVREEQKILEIPVHLVLQLRDSDPAMDRFLKAHFIMTIAHGSLISKVHAMTSIYGLIVAVVTY